MAEEFTTLSPRRALGWAAIGALVLAAVTLYFLYSPAVPPLTADAAADTAVVR